MDWFSEFAAKERGRIMYACELLLLDLYVQYVHVIGSTSRESPTTASTRQPPPKLSRLESFLTLRLSHPHSYLLSILLAIPVQQWLSGRVGSEEDQAAGRGNHKKSDRPFVIVSAELIISINGGWPWLARKMTLFKPANQESSFRN